MAVSLINTVKTIYEKIKKFIKKYRLRKVDRIGRNYRDKTVEEIEKPEFKQTIET
jgi:hypothetical protein